ncbi:MAG: hypothetical protein PVF47_04755 [Anaerolineae bacterium]|jgi:hypothetical protein
MTAIRVHVERLVLDGLAVAPGEGPALQAAVEAELAQLLAEGGLAPHLSAGGARPYARGGMVRAGGDSAAGLGRQIARAVYVGIGDRRVP